jgi:DNA (cytosine-5)-methyltransferase 1
MPVYYNELDSYCCHWLEHLTHQDHLPPGWIDNRDVHEVQPGSLETFNQCHFFAGIGGWPLALRWAGWPDDEKVWTGSLPCQPMGVQGQKKGAADARHLWPEFYRLIKACEPPVIFGEQVASGLGRAWITAVRADLEELGFRFRAVVIPACGVGSPTLRRRQFWVADTEGAWGRRRSTLDQRRAEKLRRSSAHLRKKAMAWPDGCGPKTALTQSDLLSSTDGFPTGMGRLRAYGNAIVPELAATFIEAYLRSV